VIHPDKHDPENFCTDEDLRDESWFKEYEEYMEWREQANQINDEERA
jgi:hypothetical protein